MKLPSRLRRPQDGDGLTWRPIPAWWWMLAAAGAVVIVALVVTVWLLAIAHGAHAGTDRANARLDAVRTGLAAGAGAGAAVGLMLAFRRQHHQEVSTALTDRDATERRITELYTKAVEQLGSEKAPVRLGGLYALERLAQDNPTQRQTIVNVVCAYLRMPFAPEAPSGTLEPGVTPDVTRQEKTEALRSAWRQEREVRFTAQQLLAEHLYIGRAEDRGPLEPPGPIGPPGPRFWPDISLDLTGATLINFSLDHCVMAYANFSEATFNGNASFNEAKFSGTAAFYGANFSSEATFLQTVFGGRAEFKDATFGSAVLFDAATFGDAAVFSAATFGDKAWFRGAIFTGDVWFEDATFSGWTVFAEAQFNGGKHDVHFRRSHVLAETARPSWPDGWRLGPDGKGGHTVVREENAGPVASP